MLEVRLLGKFAVKLDGQPIEIPLRPAQALLAYLMLTAGTSHRREKLAGLLWPDSDENTARRNLRQNLWRLRQAIGEGYILADKVSIAFDARATYELDVHTLEDEQAEMASPDELIRHISVYEGRLLPGFYDEWVLLEQERLEAIFADRMRLLLDRLTQEARWREVSQWAERWIALGHVPEPAYRALMIAHAALGNQASVAAVYQRCAEILREEVGVEPAQETHALYEQLSKGEKPSGVGVEATRGDRATYLAPRDDLRPQPPAFLDQKKKPLQVEPSAFIGRELELARLDRVLQKTLAGRGQILFVTGEAGQGKTSLLNEFVHRAQAVQPDLIVTSGICDVYTGVGDPFLPFRDVISMLTADIEAQWAVGAITRDHALRLWHLLPHAVQALLDYGPELIDTFLSGRALAGRAGAYAHEGSDWLTRLQALIAGQTTLNSGQSRDQKRIFEEYTAVLKALASQRPLLLIFDDLHWADLSSISLLGHLGRRIGESPIFIVGAYRPEEVAQGRDSSQHPLEDILGEFKRHFGDIWIDLDRSDLAKERAFVDALLDSEPNQLGEDFRQDLTRRCGGHPLFTVELLRDMQERGDLRQDAAGRWIEGADLGWDSLPARVEGVIERRIGRLDRELQEALTVASVEGEEFTAEVVARVQSVDERTLVRRLSSELDKQHRLVQEQGSRRLALGGQRLSRYRFRHNLFQQFLYNSLGRVERAYQHEAVGTGLEMLYGERVEEIAVQLARHFQAAGLNRKAIEYMQQAGEQAVRNFANQEAINFFNEALTLLKALPDSPEWIQQELDLLLALGPVLTATRGFGVPEVERTYNRTRELIHKIGETPEFFPVLCGLHLFYIATAQYQTAQELAEQLLDLAQREGDPTLLMLARAVHGMSLYYPGEFVPAREQLDEALRIYDPKQHRSLAFHYGVGDLGVFILCHYAQNLWGLGYADQAVKRINEALALAREGAHPFSLGWALGFAGNIYQACGEVQAVRECAEAAISHSTKMGFPHWLAQGTMHQGWVWAQQGQIEEGLAQMRQGFSGWRATGMALGLTQWPSYLAEGYGKAGQAQDGLNLLAKVLAVVEKNKEGYWLAELHRFQGELLLMQDKAATEVETCFRRALDIARNQRAKSFELRAAMSLSRLWQHQGKKDEARQLLAKIYDWFTEGFETHDLKEARALLKELS